MKNTRGKAKLYQLSISKKELINILKKMKGDAENKHIPIFMKKVKGWKDSFKYYSHDYYFNASDFPHKYRK